MVSSLAFLCAGSVVASAAATKITLFHMPGLGREAWFKAGVDAFMAQNPDIQVDIVSDWMGKYTVMTAAGTPPDVFSYDAQYLPSLVTQHQLLPLDNFIAGDGFDLSPYIQASVDALRWKGQLYALPRSVDILGVRYNRDAFAQDGVANIDDSWTWDDLVANGKKLTHDDNGDGQADRFGFADTFGNSLIGPTYVWAAGGKYWNEDYTKSLIDSPAAVTAFQFWYDIYNKYRIGPPTDGTFIGQAWSLFDDQKTAILQETRSRTSPFGHDFEVGVAPQFIGPVGRAGGFTLGFVGVQAQSKHPDAAWRLVKFLASREGFAAGRTDIKDQGVYGLLSPLRTQAAEQLRQDHEIGGEWWLQMSEIARISPATHVGDPKIRIGGPDWDRVKKGESVASGLTQVVQTTNAKIQALIDKGVKW